MRKGGSPLFLALALEMSRLQEVYQIVYNDNGSDLYSYGVPDSAHEPAHTRALYSSLGDAKRALLSLSKKFQQFVPVAYGQAYPFEHVSFDQELARSGYANFGWITIEAEEEDEADTRFAIGLLRLTIL